MSESSELGSLGQVARSNQLKSARWIMIIVGLLSLAVNGFLFANVKAELDNQVRELNAQGMQADPVEVQNLIVENQIIYGIGALLGVVFITLGVLVYRFPVPCTVLALLLYVGSIIGFGILAPMSVASGLLIKIFITIALAKSVSTALAYQKERAMEEPSSLAMREGF